MFRRGAGGGGEHRVDGMAVAGGGGGRGAAAGARERGARAGTGLCRGATSAHRRALRHRRYLVNTRTHKRTDIQIKKIHTAFKPVR